VSAGLALAADPGVVERSADPGEFIVQACERAKAWLTDALEHGDIDAIVESKSQAEAIRVYTTSKQLGMDAQLAATEIVRRAERGIGVAIRRGQQAGAIRRQGQGRGCTQQLAKPTDFASHDELMGNQAGIYDLTDDVTDGAFEAALAGARAEQNLSRANLVRKLRQQQPHPAAPSGVPDSAGQSPQAAARRRELIGELAGRGMSAEQIGDRLGLPAAEVRQIAAGRGITIPADQVPGAARRFDPNRITEKTVHSLEGLAMGVGLADIAGIDPAEAGAWAASMDRSLRVLRRFARQIKQIQQTETEIEEVA
jgi:DNA-binding NarL/FixJ family response regulator